MANTTYEKEIRTFQWGSEFPNGIVWKTLVHSDQSVSSPKKPSGGLSLQANSHSWDHRVSSVPVLFNGDPNRPAIPVTVMDPISLARYEDLNSRDVVVNLVNEALARFTGKVRKHNASLGVTLGSWKQSADMIRSRSEMIAEMIERRNRVVEKMSAAKRRRIRLQGTASAFLEGEFGWLPLVKDIQDSLGTLSRNPPDLQWVRTSARAENPWKWDNRGSPGQTWIIQEGSESYLVTISSGVSIVSQNLFLANRLGLLNLPGVAWDLIPWSFVFNMFNNMSQMVNSLTDFVGLSFHNGSTTRTVKATVRQRGVLNPSFNYYVGSCECTQYYTRRTRTLGLPSPTFKWRVPNLNLELVAIAAALPLQRLNRLNNLVGYRP